jgi:hypothetical protein
MADDRYGSGSVQDGTVRHRVVDAASGDEVTAVHVGLASVHDLPGKRQSTVKHTAPAKREK